MVRGHIERFEIVPVVFHLGPFGDFKAHGDEYVLQFVAHLGHEVDMAPGCGCGHALSQRSMAGPEQSHHLAQVEPLGCGLAASLLGRELGVAVAGQLLELGPGGLEGLAQLTPCRRRQVPKGGGDSRKFASFPKGFRLDGAQGGHGGGPSDQRSAALQGRSGPVPINRAHIPGCHFPGSHIPAHIPASLPEPASSCRDRGGASGGRLRSTGRRPPCRH